MKYIFIISIGMLILIVFLVFLILDSIGRIREKTYTLVRVGIDLVITFFVIIFIFAGITSAAYNYCYEAGTKLISIKKYEEAITSLNNALAIRMRLGNASTVMDKKLFGFPLFFSSETILRMTLGSAYKKLKKYSDAIEHYSYVVSSDKENFNAVAGLAESYLIIGDYSRAYTYYHIITKIKTQESCNYHITMGKAYMVLVDYEKAISHFKKASSFTQEKDLVNHYIELCKKHMINRKGKE